MNKTRLHIENLTVETFETTLAASDGTGTVHGYWSQVGTCDARVGTCQYGGSCGPGCGTRLCTVDNAQEI